MRFNFLYLHLVFMESNAHPLKTNNDNSTQLADSLSLMGGTSGIFI